MLKFIFERIKVILKTQVLEVSSPFFFAKLLK